MKLTQDHIHFIDTYLKNTDIQFVDVRLELLDHIASAVEQDMEENNRSFYDAFKEYMVRHKKQLERDYEKLRKDLQKKSFDVLGRKMVTPPFLVLLVFSIVLLLVSEQRFEYSFPYVKFVFGAHVFTGLVYFVNTIAKRSNRFSSLEMLVWPILLSSCLLNFYFNLSNSEITFIDQMQPLLSAGLTSFFFTGNIAFLALFIQKRKEVKQRLA